MSMSAGNLFGQIIFPCIGFAAFVYGKKQGDFKVLVIGMILMVYPYLTPNIWALYGIGLTLTAGLFLFHN